MDPELLRTLEAGDVENLIKLCETCSHEFFLGQTSGNRSNMLHILCSTTQIDQASIEESLKRLPIQVVRKLLCQTDTADEDPLFSAARYSNLDIAKLLVNGYNRSCDDDSLVDDLSCPPWRAKNRVGQLPLQVAACTKGQDEVAAYLISVDPDVCRSDDVAGSLLTYGSGPTLKAIFATGVEYSIKGFDLSRTGDLVERCSEESDALLFLTQHRELVKGLGVLAKEDLLCCAIKRNFVDVAKIILSSIDFYASTSSILPPRDPRPFQRASELGRVKIAQLMVDEFNKSFKRQLESEREAAALSNSRSFEIIEQEKENLVVALEPPWRQTDTDGITTFHNALLNDDLEFSKSIMLWDLDYLYNLTNHVHEDIHVPAAIVLVEPKNEPNFLENYGHSFPDQYSSLTTLHLETFLSKTSYSCRGCFFGDKILEATSGTYKGEGCFWKVNPPICARSR